jgi:hypothetical protein
MDMLKLKNGSEEAKPLVIVTMMSLESLFNDLSGVLAVYELREKARNPKHEFFGNLGEKLKELSLVQQDGSVHDSIKNIVLSAVEGESLQMHLVNPIAQQGSPSP